MTKKEAKQKEQKSTEIVDWTIRKVNKIYRFAFNKCSIQANKNHQKNDKWQQRRLQRRVTMNRVHKRFKAQQKQPDQKSNNLCNKKLAENSAGQFTCPICLSVLIFPVVTACQHIFCFKCLEQDMIFRSNCAVCRNPIRRSIQLAFHTKLQQIIDNKIETILTPEEQQSYQERAKEDLKYIEARTLNKEDLREGEQIDVRDTQFIWCKAVIKGVIKGVIKEVIKQINCNQNQGLDVQLETIESILIHYIGWSQLYDQRIKTDSKRLAPKGTFTLRTDIPRYELGDNQNNLRAALAPSQQQRLDVEAVRNRRNLFDFFFMHRQDMQQREHAIIPRLRVQQYLQQQIINLQREEGQQMNQLSANSQPSQFFILIPQQIDYQSDAFLHRNQQIRQNSLLQNFMFSRLNPSHYQQSSEQISYSQDSGQENQN